MTGDSRPSLVFEDVSCELGGRTVLDGIDLHVVAGSPLGVTGPSGGGKTALCLLAAGVVPPTRGCVRFGERVVSGPGHGLGDRLSIGLVLQTHGLVMGLTAEETVSLPLQAARVARATSAARSREVLDSVGLGEHAGRFVEDLSGGERQRVGIARALVTEPDVLVADEPTAELDPDNRERVLRLLLAFAARPAVLLVASDDEEMIGACASTVRLEDGKVVSSSRA